METIKGKANPIFPDGSYQDVEMSQLSMPTWFLIGFLIVVFYILKKFIYTKDATRHGK